MLSPSVLNGIKCIKSSASLYPVIFLSCCAIIAYKLFQCTSDILLNKWFSPQMCTLIPGAEMFSSEELPPSHSESIKTNLITESSDHGMLL